MLGCFHLEVLGRLREGGREGGREEREGGREGGREDWKDEFGTCQLFLG